MLDQIKFIPTNVHGYIDYATGAFLSTSPFYLTGVKRKKTKKEQENQKDITDIELSKEIKKLQPQQIIPYAMGVASTAYSLFTNYELGAVRKIPMKVHLMIDAASGALMAASPWIFGFYKKTWIPFVAIGVMEIAVALFTKTEIEDEVMQPSLV